MPTGSATASPIATARHGRPKGKRIYAECERRVREKAPSDFRFRQNDTLGISRKVAYEARPDEWLWLFAAKPAS